MSSIRTRMLIIVLGMLLPTALLFSWYSNQRFREAQDRALAEQDARLRLRQEVTGEILRGANASLNTILASEELRRRDFKAVSELLARVDAAQPEYIGMVVADESGKVVAQGRPTTQTVNIADRGYFRTAKRSETAVLGEYQISRTTGQPNLTLARSVRNAQGAVKYVAAIGLSVRYLEQVHSRVEPAPGAIFMLIDRTGRIVARFPGSAEYRGKLAAGVAIVDRFRSGRSGTVTARGVDGVERTYFYGPVQGPVHGLYAATGSDLRVLFADGLRQYRIAMSLLALVTIASLIFAWTAAQRWFLTPIRQMGDVTRALSHADFSKRDELPTRITDEIGVLAREIDTMARGLESRMLELGQARDELSGLNQDLERRVALRTRELETANQELESFGYSVSHDLRAPLRSIAGFAQALHEDHADTLDEQGLSDLIRIRAAANRMGELIDALLKLSRLGRAEMDLRPIDLGTVARDISARLAESEPERQVDLTVTGDMNATADAALMDVLFENLLSNAWKFTKKATRPSIRVGAREIDGERVFYVEDNGAGFDMAYADKLFGAFQRLHAQEEFPGLGVGLTTAARIVHRHGGRIWADSTPGAGATFYFTLGSASDR